MKTAIYIEDGVSQLVLTPETDFEMDAMQKFRDHPIEAEIHVGTFYECKGGWNRHSETGHGQMYANASRDKSEQSLIIRVTDPEPTPVPAMGG